MVLLLLCVGLGLLPSRAAATARWASTRRNVDHLRSEPPALKWMRDQALPPTARDRTRLDSGPRLGPFWAHCKSENKCMRAPYDQLLTNPVLKADYHNSRCHAVAREVHESTAKS